MGRNVVARGWMVSFGEMAKFAPPLAEVLRRGAAPGGHAQRYGISKTAVRLGFVVSMLLPGPQILLYLAGWALLPKE